MQNCRTVPSSDARLSIAPDEMPLDKPCHNYHLYLQSITPPYVTLRTTRTCYTYTNHSPASLPSMSRVSSSDAFPLLPSITVSAGPSRPTSRRTSFDRARKVRISEDVERHGEGSGRSTPSGLHSRRSGEHGSGDRNIRASRSQSHEKANDIVFKAPDDEDEHSASAPLLSVISGGRATSSEEERELWEAEGPNSELRGTLLDGIANVRPHFSSVIADGRWQIQS